MKTTDIKAEIRRFYPDAKIKELPSGDNRFQLVATDNKKEVVIGEGSQKNIAWRNAWNQMN